VKRQKDFYFYYVFSCKSSGADYYPEVAEIIFPIFEMKIGAQVTLYVWAL
jgi:hypothetical protein